MPLGPFIRNKISRVVVVVVVAALFVFGGLHFDLVLGLTLFVLSLRRDSNKNSSKPCSYVRRVLNKMRPSILYLLYVKLATYVSRVLCKLRLILFRINGPIVKMKTLVGTLDNFVYP